MRYNGRSISVEGGHARFMRLKKTAEGVEVFSMMPWEEEHLVVLAAQGRVWVPFSSMGKPMQVLGKIHSGSRAFELNVGVEIVDRQVVVLGPLEQTQR